ncbi:hypothetical protein D3C71_2155440 [compost metagenome]
MRGLWVVILKKMPCIAVKVILVRVSVKALVSKPFVVVTLLASIPQCLLQMVSVLRLPTKPPIA